jgi:hypothetical protein
MEVVVNWIPNAGFFDRRHAKCPVRCVRWFAADVHGCVGREARLELGRSGWAAGLISFAQSLSPARASVMGSKLRTIGAYLALLAISLPVPLLQRITGQAIEGMRVGGLHPIDLLAVRSVGEASWVPVLVITLCLILSFFHEAFTRFSVIAALAICQAAFTAFYACTVTVALVLER